MDNQSVDQERSSNCSHQVFNSGCGCNDASVMVISITISPTTGGQFNLEVRKTDSIEHVKKIISKKLKVLRERICLLYRDRWVSIDDLIFLRHIVRSQWELMDERLRKVFISQGTYLLPLSLILLLKLFDYLSILPSFISTVYSVSIDHILWELSDSCDQLRETTRTSLLQIFALLKSLGIRFKSVDLVCPTFTPFWQISQSFSQ
jgi:hypothetical protein